MRFFDRLLPDPDIQALYDLGRLVKSGTYLSPVYGFEEPVRPDLVQWTGIIPPDVPFDPFAVRVIGYETPASAASPVVAWTKLLGPSGRIESLRDAPGYKPVRSIRYTKEGVKSRL